MEKIIFAVLESCMTASPTRSESARAPGSGQSRAGSSHGPAGQLDAQPFWANQS